MGAPVKGATVLFDPDVEGAGIFSAVVDSLAVFFLRGLTDGPGALKEVSEGTASCDFNGKRKSSS